LKKILIADDHPEIIELLKDTLISDDFELSFCGNGKKAFLMAKKIQPELVIMDIMMPGSINGLQATKMIRMEPMCRESKIMILSAKGKVKDKIKAIEAGASVFIEKPFSPGKLLKKIEYLLEG
jgi:DNA-binding response OmpR family regulator